MEASPSGDKGWMRFIWRTKSSWTWVRAGAQQTLDRESTWASQGPMLNLSSTEGNWRLLNPFQPHLSAYSSPPNSLTLFGAPCFFRNHCSTQIYAEWLRIWSTVSLAGWHGVELHGLDLSYIATCSLARLGWVSTRFAPLCLQLCCVSSPLSCLRWLLFQRSHLLSHLWVRKASETAGCLNLRVPFHSWPSAENEMVFWRR